MLFSEINPFVRYSRTLEFTKDRIFAEYIPCDCRFFYVDEGCGKIKIDGRVITPEKGSAVIINASVPYMFIPSDVRYLAINFDYTQSHRDITVPVPPINSPGTSGLSVIETVNFTDIPMLNKYIAAEKMYSARSTLLKIESEYSKKLPFYETSTSALLASLLTDAVRKSLFFSSDRYGIEDIVSYIHEHYNENITNLQLSEIFHFHPNYINELFKKKLGKSLHRYIMETRISNAVIMLEEGGKTIEEISRETGFYDGSYFSRYFKKIIGISPKNYR